MRAGPLPGPWDSTGSWRMELEGQADGWVAGVQCVGAGSHFPRKRGTVPADTQGRHPQPRGHLGLSAVTSGKTQEEGGDGDSRMWGGWVGEGKMLRHLCTPVSTV